MRLVSAGDQLRIIRLIPQKCTSTRDLDLDDRSIEILRNRID